MNTATRTIAATMATAAVLVAAGCATNQPDTDNVFREVARQSLDDKDRAGLVADETSMSLQTAGEDEHDGFDVASGQYRVTVDELVKVLTAFDAPQSLYQRLDHTRALDGMQATEWEDTTHGITVDATWTYHPDNGLWLVLEEGNQP